MKNLKINEDLGLGAGGLSQEELVFLLGPCPVPNYHGHLYLGMIYAKFSIQEGRIKDCLSTIQDLTECIENFGDIEREGLSLHLVLTGAFEKLVVNDIETATQYVEEGIDTIRETLKKKLYSIRLKKLAMLN